MQVESLRASRTAPDFLPWKGLRDFLSLLLEPREGLETQDWGSSLALWLLPQHQETPVLQTEVKLFFFSFTTKESVF